jgi:hypothetical protein
MKTTTRALALALGVWAVMPAPAAAQTIGTFRWQLQPYCNLITVIVTQVGSVYTLEGTDDQCGASQAASVTGTAFPNPDGTIGLGFNVVAAPGGAPSHIDATVTLPAASGTWRDSQGNSGSFVLTSGGGTGGSPRPLFSSVVSFTRAVNFTFTTPTALVPLTSTADTTVSFNLNAPGPRVLTFSAECAIDGANTSAYLDLDILHNGVALSPTAGNQDAWCAANGTADADGWIRGSITLVVSGVAGVNTIQVQARRNNAATTGWIGDISLVIH